MLALLVGTVCGGQQPAQKVVEWPRVVSVPAAEHKPMVIAGDGVTLTMQKNGDVLAEAKSLQCPKYQHLTGAQASCHCNDKGCTCDPPKPKCAPDLHVVTEREWQELMARLKKMESKEMPCKNGDCVQIVAPQQ